MASGAIKENLPLFYKDLLPLNSKEHGTWKSKGLTSAKFLQNQHAIPVTVDEFISASRFYPIVFSAGDNSVPLVLMGMNEGVNVFVDDEGVFTQNNYVPAYARRYPYILAKLTPDSQELSLCFDPTADALGESDEGEALFDGDDATEATKRILKFCEDFEQAGARTQAFMKYLEENELLMEGEVSIQQNGTDKPFVYRGFKMIDEKKLLDMRGDELRKLNQNGMLPLIHAHLFSLQIMRDLFALQSSMGKTPVPEEIEAAAAEAEAKPKAKAKSKAKK